MTERTAKVLENTTKEMETFSKGQEAQVSDVAHASELIRDAFPVSKYGNATAACWAAFLHLKLKTERRARSIWNGEARRIDGWEMDALRRAALEESRRERQRTLDKIAALEAALMAVDPDFHSGSIEALQQQSCRQD